MRKVLNLIYSFIIAFINVAASQSCNAQVTFSITPLGSVELCSGTTVTIHADSIPAGYTYIWHRDLYDNCSSPGWIFEQIPEFNGMQDIEAGGTYVYWCEVIDQNGIPAGQSSNSVWTTSTGQAEPICFTGSLTFCKPSSIQLFTAGVWAGSTIPGGIQLQWQLNGADISGATWSWYDATVSGTYRCKFSNSCGSVYSNSFTVTANPLPSANITASGPTTFCAGESVTLNAVLAANRTYQWKKNGTNIPGATAAGYTASVSGTYKVTVTNAVTGCSKTTGTGTVITKNPLPPATITPPGTITFCAGQSVLLTANSGTGYAYKWKKNGTYINGATAQTYTVASAGKYRVEVTSSYGCTKTSNADTANVPCREDENIPEIESDFNIEVYPNPSSGNFVFNIITSNDENISIVIFDIIGKQVVSESFHTTLIVPSSSLAPGIYTAVIVAGANKKIVRVVKTE